MVPAASGEVHELDEPDHVGLCVSVLHLPPGSTVQAAYMETSLGLEGRELSRPRIGGGAPAGPAWRTGWW